MRDRCERSEVCFAAMQTRIAIVAAVLGVVALVGTSACGGSGSDDPGPDWPVGEDAGSGTDATETGPPDQSQSTTVRLVNDGSKQFWVRRPKSACRGNSPGWIELQENGERRSPLDSCGVCNCDTLEKGEGCGPCPDVACGRGAAAVSPGEAVEWTWPGTFYRRGTVDGESCESPYVPDGDASLSAEICWSLDSNLGDGSFQCETTSFEYGEDQIVKTVRPGQNQFPVRTEFVFENESDRALTVTEPTACRGVDKEWVSLRDGETTVDFERDCTICSCEDARSGVCGACSKACVPSSTRLPAGESVEMTWEGTGYRVETVDGVSCHEEWTPSVGKTLTARFCFDEDDPSLDTEKTCRDVSFEYGDDPNVTFTYDG